MNGFVEHITAALGNPDQLFVELKQAVLSLLPVAVKPLASILLSISPIMAVFPLLFAITTLMERKVLGRIQNRYGPNRVGPFGSLQPIADGVKMLIKEDIVPTGADKLLHFLAPIILLVPTLLAYAVIPFGRNMIPAEMDSGLLFFFAAGASTELAVFLAGWASYNKYSFLGGVRAISQMISYELPLILSAIVVVLITGTLSTTQIVEAQGGFAYGFIPRWHVFTPWGMAAFLVFLIAALAESNRSPFDIPEAESEIIAGHLTEYSGFKYAIFFLAEYLGLFVMSAMAITLFLGGWQAPLPFLEIVPSWCWFFGKLCGLIFLFIWIRGTVPRVRVDQLLGLAWKFLIPLSLVALVVAAFWHLSRGWSFQGALIVRWLSGFVVVFGAYLALSDGLAQSAGRNKKRTYVMAD